jgi:beta-mannosidase
MMPRHIVNIGDNHWYFGQVPRRPFTSPNVHDLPDVTEWLTATVPGNVRPDLLSLGRIPDPFWAEDYKKSLWVEDVDWWYRRTIEMVELLPTQRAFLIFEGIDYLSAVFVNEQEMARHEGMFSRQIIDITTALQTGSTEVAVRLWGSSALPRRELNWLQQAWQKVAAPLYRSWVGIYPDRTATLKCQMSFGWDFAPPIRTMGIWDEVTLVTTGPVFIAEASASGQPLDPPSLPPGATHTPAKISLDLTLDADQARQVEVMVATSPANFEGLSFNPIRFLLDLPAGHSTQQVEFDLPWIGLWQPWDRGQPRLYNLHITLNEPDGTPLDEVIIRTGICSVALEEWQFHINGQPEFIRGVNWVPADSLPGWLREENYARLLTRARESGANLLRVWGGGLREKRAFYDLCDEMGLLVWQEFPFSCMFLGSFPRHPAYLAQVEAECSAIIRQLRHHPCVATWCGGNEFSQWRNRPLLKTLARVTNQNDPTRPFIPVSPSFGHNWRCGQGGDAHNWHVWHGNAPIRAFQTEFARFLSEFGLQALPHPDTLKACLPNPATGWETHYADLDKLARYTSPFDTQSTKQETQRQDAERQRLEGKDNKIAQTQTPSLAAYISASQRAQAVALQTAIEQMRRRKDEAGGVCLWQFNEPWPAISWAIVDYFGRPKLAYTQLSAWYNPILISLKFPVGHRWQVGETFRAEIWSINDSLQAYSACELQVNIDETPMHSQSFDLRANSVQLVGMLAHRLNTIPRQITLTLHHQNEILAQNHYDLDWFDEARGSFSGRLRRWVADIVLR